MRNKPPTSILFQTRDFLLEADVAFQMTQSIVGDHRVLYASGPLDSGPRLYRLMKELGVPDQGEVVRKIGLDEFRRRVREPNEQELSRFSRQLRITRGDMVIDPGILKVPDWSGGHYSYFFLEVIRRFVREIWLMDGWELSSGATKEFVAASIGMSLAIRSMGCQSRSWMGVRSSRIRSRGLNRWGWILPSSGKDSR